RRRRTAPALGRTQTQQIVDVAGRLFFARLLGQRRLALQVFGEQLLQGLRPAFLQRLERGLFLGLLARCFFGRLASLFLFGLFPSLFGGLLLLFFLLGLLARGDFRLTLLLCGLAFGLGLSSRLGLLLFLGLAQPELLHFRLAGGGLLRLAGDLLLGLALGLASGLQLVERHLHHGTRGRQVGRGGEAHEQ